MMNKDFITTIQELLKGRNDDFDNTNKERIRLMRHKDTRETKVINGRKYKNSLYNLFLNENKVFMDYQSEQLKKKFKDVDYIVTFIGEGEKGVSSRFLAVYKNCGIIREIEDYNGEEQAVFDFRKVEGFELLQEKVIIDWHNPISWLQRFANEMPVTRIDRGLEENNIPVFTRFEDVLLDYNQLKNIFDTQNDDWKSKLKSCNCVYLILDKFTGKQYVGSTYNPSGIWGRWELYVNSGGHAENIDLKSLLSEDVDYAKKYFQWCILETLPLKIPQVHAIDRESLYKRKFGTLEHGYNNN